MIHFNHFRRSRRGGSVGRAGRRGGSGRGFLRRLGPSWVYAPLRRVIQVLALAAFAALVILAPRHDHTLARRVVGRGLVGGELFLALDPLVSVSAAVASWAWVWPLSWAAGLLLVSLVFPRGFCGYLCPLGTLIDAADWGVGRFTGRRHVRRRGALVHLRYFLVVGVLTAAAAGVMLAGFLAAIPLVTRGLSFVLGPVQGGVSRGWSAAPPVGAAGWVGVGFLAAVLGLTFLGRRFWCRCLCPSGAVFSAWSALRLAERRVEGSCVKCGTCVEACPFGAVREDFSTRPADCTFCQTCGGACPVGAITFVPRWARSRQIPPTAVVGRDSPQSPPTAVGGKPARPARPLADRPLSRRGFLVGCGCSVAGGAALALGSRTVFGAGLGGAGAHRPVRPPGSIPEAEFLRRCVRCGNCIKACTTGILQPLALAQGIEGAWTPHAAADIAGCDPECTNCGRSCPTGAIRPLSQGEKKVARMGLAVVNQGTCLPHANRAECSLCVQACAHAGYNAIEYLQVHIEFDEDGNPDPQSGRAAPVVLADKCVGCGLCQSRCYAVNVEDQRLLTRSAIIVEAGPGKEDRIRSGSYRALREAERRRREAHQPPAPADSQPFLPDFLR